MYERGASNREHERANELERGRDRETEILTERKRDHVYSTVIIILIS